MKTKKTPSFQTKMLFLVGLGVVVFALFLIVVSFPKGEDKLSLAEQTLTKKRYEIQTDGYPSIGPENAPVVIVEFSDFNCQYCGLFARTSFPVLMSKYPQEIRFVFRHAPLGPASSFEAAQASICAYDQDYFWEYHDALFENRDRLGAELYTEIATSLELDLLAFNTCLENDDYIDSIEADLDFALTTGIRGTPTFFINGLALVGAQPTEVFTEIIDAELTGINSPE
jgi:protein-disulfide isomerase